MLRVTSSQERKGMIMFTSDYVFVTPASTVDEMVDLFVKTGFDEKQSKRCMDEVMVMGGAYCISAPRDIVQNMPSYLCVPHFMKRLPPPVGHSITVIDLVGLTPDEDLAIMAHEFGHAGYNHKPTLETALQCELEADYFAVVLVGAVHLHSALTKIVEKFKLQDDDIITKRLEVLEQYM